MAIMKYISIAQGKTVDDGINALNKLTLLTAGVLVFADNPAEFKDQGVFVDNVDDYTLYSVTFDKVETTQ